MTNARRELRDAVESLLDNAYRNGEIVTHSPDCPNVGERCLAHAVLIAFGIEHADSVCDDVTRIVRRWLISRRVPVA